MYRTFLTEPNADPVCASYEPNVLYRESYLVLMYICTSTLIGGSRELSCFLFSPSYI